ncbi:anthranilate synthase component 1 [Glaciecola sp. XM2]|uniref:anthranilate synthase component 1 n=1 Tax=Glaciecola sp. XM2 TaxID=1914931 RepID=UPI001BDE9183|nr:anthranilate synthase component 1 [Glaciecola sp. XM2]MBT1452101.1 anthranilate synthase component 1 [Glaciecola sp. XM2]
MSLSQLGTAPGKVETIEIEAPYVSDPLSAYKAMATPHSILLESAEIDSKDNLKSLILVDAALRIECNGQDIIVTALTDNGLPLIEFLREKLSVYLRKNADDHLHVTFPSSGNELDEDARLKQPSVFDVLRTLQQDIQALREHPHAVFLGGVFAYDLLASFEQLPDVPKGANHCPDYVFYLAESLILIDHQHQSTQILGSVFSSHNVAHQYFEKQQRLEQIKRQLSDLHRVTFPKAHQASLSELKVDKDDEHYCKDVLALQEHILDGDIFQVVPSRSFSLPCADPLLAYKRLKQTNPSPYMFYLQDNTFAIFGASPESALKYEQHSNQVEIYPIAGTRPRGKRADGSIDLDLDSRLELNLQQDEKEKSEHIMLVDLARNDVAKVCEPGTRFVKDLLKVDRYSHVMHLVSRVVGQLRKDLDALHAYQACMNMGTLVGAPKISAATLIRETEKCTRGSYGGAVGYLNGNGDFDTCIVIRSAFVSNDVAYIQAGAGVVKDSKPQSEADETRAKAQAVIQAIITANTAAEGGDNA